MNNKKQIFIYIAFGIVLYWGLNNYQLLGSLLGNIIGLISSFLVGIGIAFVLNVPVTSIEKLLLKRTKLKPSIIRIISIVSSLLLLIGIVAFVLFLIIPELMRTLSSFMASAPQFLEDIKNWALSITNQNESIKNIDWEQIRAQILKISESGISILFTSSLNFIKAIISSVVTFFMGVVFAIYMLLEKERLTKQLKLTLYAFFKKKHIDKLYQFSKVANTTFAKFISGQCTEALILGLLFFIGMIIFRFPYALTISAFIAITSLVPVFGSTLACIIGAFLIFLQSPIQAVWFIIFFLVIQQLEGNLIYPKVVGKSVGLPPIWVMLAVILGGSIGGILGMLVSVPISAVVYSIMKSCVKDILEKKKNIIDSIDL